MRRPVFLGCMGRLRAPICYLDDYAHRWFPWTFCGHWCERVDQVREPFICRLHYRMGDRYWARRFAAEDARADR